MNAPANARRRREKYLVLCFSAAAALRVFIYSAAFPFFTQVDEDLHFDLVLRYSHGQPPTSFDFLSPEALDWIVPYASPEFLQTADSFPGGMFPAPLWKESLDEATPVMAVTRAVWAREVNFELAQPPLYYMIAATWSKLGFPFKGLTALYWLRFLNLPLVVLLVLLGYRSACIISPQSRELHLGTPLLLALFPQNVFYSINSDVLSAVVCGWLFVLTLRWLNGESSLRLVLLTALAIAAAYLTKLNNVPLLVVTALFLLVNARQLFRRGQRRAAIYSIIAVVLALLPIFAWMFWTKRHFGDLTGSAGKAALLTWIEKPVFEWFNHPLFTAHGLVVFWSDLISTFWRGETKWHNQPLSFGPADTFYCLSTAVAIFVTLISLRKAPALAVTRKALFFSFLAFLSSVLFLALLSIQFDFGSCINPSRSHPYFTSGRLLTGVLVPFALLYIFAITRLLRPINKKLPLIAIIVLVLGVTTSEIFTNRVIFSSEHNWFHR
ncbi:MAG: hypothetical protein JO354_03470 [Verrucomicrobia bacterium]|nr:hypothetical protein [Verrucomicrobiota bacterium]